MTTIVKSKDVDESVKAFYFASGGEKWVGESLSQVAREISKISGDTIEDIREGLEIIPRVYWDMILIIDSEVDFQPRYTLSAMIVKDMLAGCTLPFMVSITEF